MFVCLSVCLFVPYGRPNGWADRDELDTRTHVHPGSVSGKVNVKVKARYVCGTDRSTKHPQSDTWRAVLTLRPDDGGGDT